MTEATVIQEGRARGGVPPERRPMYCGVCAKPVTRTGRHVVHYAAGRTFGQSNARRPHWASPCPLFVPQGETLTEVHPG